MIAIRLIQSRLLLAALGFNFALSSLITPTAHASPPPALAAIIAKSYDPRVTFFEGAYEESMSGCRKGRAYVTGVDPVSHLKRDITIKQYRAALPVSNENRAVIIMPPTGGETIIDQRFANQLCSRGLRVVIIESFVTLEDTDVDLRMYDRNALRSLIAIRQTIDFLTKTGSQSVGILGTSLGALQASFATVIDPRLNTAVFIAGGLGLADIVASSNETTQSQLRDIRKSMWKLDQAGYAAAVRNAIHIDVTPFLDDSVKTKKKVMSVIATKDTFVPTATQVKLYEVFGRQALISFDHDHVDAIKRASVFNSLTIVDFLLENLPK